MKFTVEMDDFLAKSMCKAYSVNEHGATDALNRVIIGTLSKKLAWEVNKDEVVVRKVDE